MSDRRRRDMQHWARAAHIYLHPICIFAPLVQVLAPKPYLALAECPTHDLERFGVWTVVNAGPSWGAIRVRRRNDQDQLVHWCIAQVQKSFRNKLKQFCIDSCVNV